MFITLLKAVAFLAFCVLTIGCTESLPEAPAVRIAYGSSVSAEDITWLRSSVIVWQELGFTFEEVTLEEGLADTSRPECASSWHAEQNSADCVISILVEKGELDDLQGLANLESRLVLIDDDVQMNVLPTLGAHEYGHILLSTGAHLPNHGEGIMSDPPVNQGHLTSSDLAYACTRIGICLQ